MLELKYFLNALLILRAVARGRTLCLGLQQEDYQPLEAGTSSARDSSGVRLGAGG